MNRRFLVVSLLMVALVGLGWTLVNRGGRFGLSRYGLTTYSRLPLPIVDIQVRGDGKVRWVAKTHDLGREELGWLLSPRPEVVIVATGWQSQVHLPPDFVSSADTRVIAVPNADALPLYNYLKDQGVHVAIHVHSTC